MSPGLYAVGTAEALEQGQAAVHQQDAQGAALAYLDDTYFVGTPEAAYHGLLQWVAIIESQGLKLKWSKTQVWAPDASTILPGDLAKYRVSSLKAVGSTLAYADRTRMPDDGHADDDRADDWREVPLQHLGQTTGQDPGGTDFLQRQARYFQELLTLRPHGLAALDAYALARTWSQGAGTHLQRA